MYLFIKKIFKKAIPSKTFFKIEPFARALYAMAYRGKNHVCSLCNTSLKSFIKLPNDDLLCPNCGSLSRDRRLYTLLVKDYLSTNQKILDFSPSRCISRKLKKSLGTNYNSTDLSGNFNADFKYDITNLNIDSNSLDVIICYHILEHIEEDLKAMQELFRVLKPKGIAVIQTPFKEGDIYEDYTIKSPEERLAHFGQEDHVRVYSVKGLKERLSSCGFEVEVKNFPEKDTFFGFTANESILVITKP